eukprot:g623.t1
MKAILRPLMERTVTGRGQNEIPETYTRILELLPTAMMTLSPQNQLKTLDAIFALSWPTTLIIPLTSNLVEFADMSGVEKEQGVFATSHWNCLHVKFESCLVSNDSDPCNGSSHKSDRLDAADYAGVLKSLLEMLGRLRNRKWFEIVRLALRSVPTVSWPSVSYVVAITCQQSRRLCQIILNFAASLVLSTDIDHDGEGGDDDERPSTTPSRMTWVDLILVLAAVKGTHDVLSIDGSLNSFAFVTPETAHCGSAKSSTHHTTSLRLHRLILLSLQAASLAVDSFTDTEVSVSTTVRAICSNAYNGCADVLLDAAKQWCETPSRTRLGQVPHRFVDSVDVAIAVLTQLFRSFPGSRAQILRCIIEAFAECGASAMSLLSGDHRVRAVAKRGRGRPKGAFKALNRTHKAYCRLLGCLCRHSECAHHLGMPPLVSSLTEWTSQLYLFVSLASDLEDRVVEILGISRKGRSLGLKKSSMKQFVRSPNLDAPTCERRRLDVCSADMVSRHVRLGLFVPLHTAIAAALIASSKVTQTGELIKQRGEFATRILEQRLFIETACNVYAPMKKGRRKGVVRASKPSASSAKAARMCRIQLPYEISVWIVQRAIESSRAIRAKDNSDAESTKEGCLTPPSLALLTDTLETMHLYIKNSSKRIVYVGTDNKTRRKVLERLWRLVRVLTRTSALIDWARRLEVYREKRKADSRLHSLIESLDDEFKKRARNYLSSDGLLSRWWDMRKRLLELLAGLIDIRAAPKGMASEYASAASETLSQLTGALDSSGVCADLLSAHMAVLEAVQRVNVDDDKTVVHDNLAGQAWNMLCDYSVPHSGALRALLRVALGPSSESTTTRKGEVSSLLRRCKRCVRVVASAASVEMPSLDSPEEQDVSPKEENAHRGVSAITDRAHDDAAFDDRDKSKRQLVQEKNSNDGRPVKRMKRHERVTKDASMKILRSNPGMLVGYRLDIFWSSEDMWFRGTVEAYESSYASGRDAHLLKYDDGDRKWHCLSDCKWKFVRRAASDSRESKENSSSKASSRSSSPKKRVTKATQRISNEGNDDEDEDDGDDDDSDWHASNCSSDDANSTGKDAIEMRADVPCSRLLSEKLVTTLKAGPCRRSAVKICLEWMLKVARVTAATKKAEASSRAVIKLILSFAQRATSSEKQLKAFVVKPLLQLVMFLLSIAKNLGAAKLLDDSKICFLRDLMEMRISVGSWVMDSLRGKCNRRVPSKEIPRIRSALERFDICVMQIGHSNTEALGRDVLDRFRIASVHAMSTKGKQTQARTKLTENGSHFKRRKSRKKRLRSRNAYIDRCLADEDGTDAYADLEDWINDDTETSDSSSEDDAFAEKALRDKVGLFDSDDGETTSSENAYDGRP